MDSDKSGLQTPVLGGDRKKSKAFSIRTILMVVNVILIILFGAAASIFAYTYDNIVQERSAISAEYSKSIQLAQTLRFKYQKYTQEWQNILLRGGDSSNYHYHLKRFYEIERDILGQQDELSRILSIYQDQSPARILKDFENGFFQVGRLHRRALKVYNQSFENSQLVAESVAEKVMLDPMSVSNDLIESLENSRIISLSKTSDRLVQFKRELILVSVALTSFLLVFLYFLIGSLIVKPIKEGVALADNIARGNFSGKVHLDAISLEAYQLLHALDHMQADINKAQNELVAAKDVAESSSRAQSSFLANMSHEIRTPMNAVIGMAELLKDAKLTGEYRQYLNTLQLSGKTLITIINDILDYSRIISGKLQFEYNPINIREVLEALTLPYRDSGKDVAMKLTIDDNIPEYVLGDTTRIQQVLGNLLSNAFKFTEQGCVHLSVTCLSTKEDQVFLQFSVSDTGIGIALDALNRVFVQFEQADTSTTRRYGGTGLGLAICQKLLQLAGGDIRVESELQKGTTFYATVPFKCTETPHLEDTADESNESVDATLKILVVEDNPVNKQVIVAMLNKLGVDSEVVGDGFAALKRRCEPDFNAAGILMDCEMPIMDGYEATQKIREWEEHNGVDRIPICALTAHSMPNQIRHCLEVGMDAHLAKPIVFKKLKGYLARLPKGNAADSPALEKIQ